MNYFELYNLPESFLPDEEAIKTKYHERSQQYRPDAQAVASPEKQQEILQLSTQNTEAYRILSNFDERLKYILQQHGLHAEDQHNKLSEDFLDDINELNEQIIKLESDFNPATFEQASLGIAGKLAALEADILPVFQRYPHLVGVTQEAALEEVKNYYEKKKYLLRIQESLSKFATQS